MKIGIDARFFGPVGKGLGRYTERLIENLEQIDKENQYVIFLRQEAWNLYQPKNPNFKKTPANFHWYGFSEQIMMPLVINKEKVDLMHFPHFNVPVLYRKKFVVTIHDLILFSFPTRRASALSPLLYQIKYRAYKKVIAYAAKKARAIITVSRCTKKEIQDKLKISPQKIFITYEASGGVEYGQLKIPEKNILQKHGIIKPYLLYAGNAYPHKNLEGLIKIFKKLITNYQLNYQLVLVGKKDYFYQRIKKESARFYYDKERKIKPIVFFGFASEEVLADLYRNAALYVFPSFVEGFGLPPLEAMSYDLPVAASNSSCLPEILGKAAIYFNPHDEEEMIRVILEGLRNKDLREKLRKAGREQIKKYSWRDCARKTLRVYKQAVVA